jgi:single-strand DNA-binding protein
MARGTVNKVIVLGRLGQDPDVRATASGTQVVNLNVATNELGPRDDQGNRADSTEWHRIVIFGRMAENAATYLRKGAQVYIEGRLQTRKWQDQNGVERYSTEIVANEMQFIGGRSDNPSAGQSGGFAGQGAQGGSYQSNSPQQPAAGFGGNQPQGGFGGKPAQAPGQQAPSQQAPKTGHQPANNFDDFDDDIPF